MSPMCSSFAIIAGVRTDVRIVVRTTVRIVVRTAVRTIEHTVARTHFHVGVLRIRCQVPRQAEFTQQMPLISRAATQQMPLISRAATQQIPDI